MEKLSEKIVFQKNELENNLKIINEKIATSALKSGKTIGDITLLAATKTVPIEVINHGIKLGIKNIGENKYQELESKYENLNLKDCKLHFIGHLQTNKVKKIVGKATMIQSVDSIKLAKEISKISEAQNCITDILVEVNIGNELNKSGIRQNFLEEFLCNINIFPNICIKGLMAIPPICQKSSDARKYFSQMNKLFVDIRDKKLDNVNMDILSMGMSNDFEEAILEGSTMVRIGSSLFGKRNYL